MRSVNFKQTHDSATESKPFQHHPRLRANPFNITIIQVYAPSSSCHDSELDEFYNEVQSLVDQTPKQDILVVQGDWNVKEDAQENLGEVCGPFYNMETVDRGIKLPDFATCNNLVTVLTKTLGYHEPSSQNETHHHQIDHVLVKKRFYSGIKTA